MDEWQKNVEARLSKLEREGAVNSRDKEYMDRRFSSVEDHLTKVENKCDSGFRDVNQKLQNGMKWALVLVGGTIIIAFLDFMIGGGLNVGS